ncbi:transcriptional regulator [Opitutaceae bacterium TAV1]|nr:transcriptional regulator [Opitutaceae bacterium TAV1]
MVSATPTNTAKKPHAIYTELRRRILAGEWTEGTRLPTETDLARQFECSVVTLSKALGLLAHEGLVRRRPRVGTVIARTTPLPDDAPAAASAITPNASSPPAPPAPALAAPALQLDALAFICPSDQHDAIWRMLRGFQSAAQTRQRRIVMLTTGPDHKKEAEIIRRLAEFDVRGAAISPIFLSPLGQMQLAQTLSTSRFPLVMLGHDLAGLNCPAVGMDGFHIGHTMTRHLLDRGLRRIGFLANQARSTSSRERHMGYAWALQEAGLAEDNDIVHLDPAINPDFSDPVREPFALGAAYLEKTKNLPASARPEGVVCVNDHIAWGLIKAAAAAGLDVPGDLRVTGAGHFSISLSGFAPDFLTTYNFDYEDMGRRALLILEESIAGHPVTPLETNLRGTLLPRQSS